MMSENIKEIGIKIQQNQATIDEISNFIAQMLPTVVDGVNKVFAPRQLIKKDRINEPLPTDKRQLSAYRTRLGTMLEYAMSSYLDAIINKVFNSNLRLTFAVAHEYPDFYMRNEDLTPSARIEMKAVDADSDEQAARFDVLSGLIQGEKDVLILIAWEWQNGTLDTGIQYEYPFIFAFIVVPAAELARERDESVRLRGGRVDPDQILVPKKGSPGELTPDKGNAGKILRLIHKSRKKDAFNLSLDIQRYLQFADVVERRKDHETRIEDLDTEQE
jgi:hypothetical protein